MKTIQHKYGTLHIETHLGIVNIYAGLRDAHMRSVERVEMIPNKYAGENKVAVRGGRFVELKTKN